jgi:arylsulfatase
MDEGGISSPFIVSWPDGLKASGERRTTICHFTDILPTILDLAGVEVTGDNRPELPGVSLVPAFNEDLVIDHPILYFDHEGNKALRRGKWKLLSAIPDNRWELYDLETDRSEIHDLASRYPDLVKSMESEWESYRTYLDSLKKLN